MNFINLDNFLYTDEDLRMKFRQSFLQVSLMGGKPCIVQCLDFESPEVRLDYGRYERAHIELLKEIPEPGVFNLVGGIGRYVRLSKRQYKRGLNGESAIIFNQNENLMPMVSVVAESCFNKTFTSLEEALKQLNTSNTTVNARAITDKYWVKRSLKSKDILLMRNQINVGLFTKSRFWFNKNCDSIKQELGDDLRLATG